jgi:hypothetical protein
MRTTLDIDEDLLRTAQELARRQGVSTGKVVSRLMRAALLARPEAEQATDPSLGASRTGFVPLEPGKAMVTNDQVNRLREAEKI